MTRAGAQTTAVMAGFIPAIHVLFLGQNTDMDAGGGNVGIHRWRYLAEIGRAHV